MRAIVTALSELAALMPDYLISLENELGQDWQEQISQSLEDPIANFTLSGDGNADDVLVTLASTRVDTGWSQTGNEVTYTGAAEATSIEIAAMSFYDEDIDTTKQRIAPVLSLLKNGVIVAVSATGYQRHGSEHTDSSNNIVYTDPNPGVAPVYSLLASRGSNQTEESLIDLGHLNLKAIL